MMRTPGLLTFVIGGSLIALAATAGSAHAQTPPQTQTRQRSASVTRPRSGAHLIPYVGVSSFEGSSAKGLDTGFRAGALAGGHINEMYSLNGEVTMDLLNPNNVGSGVSFTGLNLDLALSPLVHFPVSIVEIVVGPKLGAWFGAVNQSSTLGGTTVATKQRAHGWLAGLNAGAFVSLGRSIELGGLLSFVFRKPTEQCSEDSIGVPIPESCTSSGLSSAKVLALTVALLF
jgi:hypothetical protein